CLSPAAAWGVGGSGGTCMVPLGLGPGCRSTEGTPRAGIATEAGMERRSDSHHGLAPDGPVAPAAAAEGCGACCWAATATPTAAAPPTMSRAPAIPATRARRLPGLVGLVGGGPNPPSGQDMTTRRPAIRSQSECATVVTLT